MTASMPMLKAYDLVTRKSACLVMPSNKRMPRTGNGVAPRTDTSRKPFKQRRNEAETAGYLDVASVLV